MIKVVGVIPVTQRKILNISCKLDFLIEDFKVCGLIYIRRIVENTKKCFPKINVFFEKWSKELDVFNFIEL